MSDCRYCHSPERKHGSGIDSHRFTPMSIEDDAEEMTPEYLAALQADLDELELADPDVAAAATRYRRAIDSILATRDVCAYCSHPVDHHGTTQVGCADCGCGFDGDFHPDPPRGDE